MAFCSRTFVALFALSTMAAFAQQSAPIVQPGAPGQPGKFLTEATVRTPTRPPFQADVEFMQGMIMHHSQAVEMVALLRTRGKSPTLKSFGEKISISQTDEIGFMKRWLESRGKPTTMEMDHSHMSAADMKNMNMLMPGMLTPEQMTALAKAKGAQFDHLFLTGMIQHHGGALTMVTDLFNTPGAGQDPVLFDFATDIDNTQSAEIKIMRGMLDKEKQ
ncbi:MAG: DUF305 domain-containing protein [Bryobacteraceae bacterium]|jgi:uncharacterized protein (DUF305 family)